MTLHIRVLYLYTNSMVIRLCKSGVSQISTFCINATVHQDNL